MAISGGHLFHPIRRPSINSRRLPSSSFSKKTRFTFSVKGRCSLLFLLFPESAARPHARRSFVTSKNNHGPPKNNNFRWFMSPPSSFSDEKRLLHRLCRIPTAPKI
uniref:Uncharacterized protein n=1 Tax=Solanum tuberosum TaxID=4113 RepID=M1AES7_SOLTU